MKLLITKGSTSQSVYLFIRDSSVTTGAGLTGLVYNSGSLTAYYVRDKGSATSITLATQTATGAYSSGGFVAVDGTNMPGVYRFDIPDAVLASGVNWAVVMLKGATNMEPVVLEIELTGVDLQDTVRAGLTAMPNVASGSAGAILTSGTGTAQLNVSGGRADANVTYYGGSAGTFASGIPSVNATQFAGTAYATALTAEIAALLATSVDGSTTYVQSMRLWNSALGAKASGLGTTTATFRDLADTKDRIVATVDQNGNRSALTLTLT